jgi:hypothetical protein
MSKEDFTDDMATVFKGAIASLLPGVNSSQVIIDGVVEAGVATARRNLAETGITILLRILVPEDKATELTTSLQEVVAADSDDASGATGALQGGGGLLAAMETVAQELEEAGEIPPGSASSVQATLETVTVKVVALETQQSSGETVVLVEEGASVVNPEDDKAPEVAPSAPTSDESGSTTDVIVAVVIVALIAVALIVYRGKKMLKSKEKAGKGKVYLEPPKSDPEPAKSIHEPAQAQEEGNQHEAEEEKENEWSFTAGPLDRADRADPLLGPPAWMLNIGTNSQAAVPEKLPDADALPDLPVMPGTVTSPSMSDASALGELSGMGTGRGRGVGLGGVPISPPRTGAGRGTGFGAPSPAVGFGSPVVAQDPLLGPPAWMQQGTLAFEEDAEESEFSQRADETAPLP